MHTQLRVRSACAFAQSDQNRHWAHFGCQRCRISSCSPRRLWPDCVIWVFVGPTLSDGTFSHVTAQLNKWSVQESAGQASPFRAGLLEQQMSAYEDRIHIQKRQFCKWYLPSETYPFVKSGTLHIRGSVCRKANRTQKLYLVWNDSISTKCILCWMDKPEIFANIM